jgi:hypothetical protein
MKKIFWCSVAVAVAAAGSVYLASRPVESYSLTRAGHALASLGGEESAGGEEAAPPVPVPAAVPGLPTVGSEETAAGSATAVVSETVAVAEGPLQGHIIIDEGESLVLPSSTDFATQTPESTLAAQAAPPVMPYCPDDSEACNRRMPMAEEDESGEEEAEVWELLRRAAKEANEEGGAPEKLPVTPAEVENQDGGDEESSGSKHEQYQDSYHHHHDHECVCPYTGRSYPLPPISPSAPEPSEPKKGNNIKPESMDDGEEQEALPIHKLDTMEFRPSDAGFQPFTPRPI